MQDIVAGIEGNANTPGRTEVIDVEQPLNGAASEFSVVVDAAKTPDSLSRLLDAAKEAGTRK